MSMTKQDFIALADAIRSYNGLASGDRGLLTPFTTGQINALAHFCATRSRAFLPNRWMNYVEGKCTANGGPTLKQCGRGFRSHYSSAERTRNRKEKSP